MRTSRRVDVPAVLVRLGIEPKTKGRELWSPCPIHTTANGERERTPSFRVRNDPGHEKHGFWQCFGSCPPEARGGSIAELVRLIRKLETRKEAWAWIRDQNAENEPEPPPPAIAVETSIPTIEGRGMRIPPGVAVAPVSTWPSTARDYLINVRGIPAEQAERWGLGVAATGRLAGRIFVPIHDGAGRLLNYTARTFYQREPKKTIEPKPAEGADKGAVFGERFWPAHAERRVVVMTEAGFDALAVERATGLPVGAIFGSELLPGHLLRLGTFPLILVASDPDEAGDKLWESARRQFARHARAERVVFPPGLDAAKMGETSSGLDELRELVLAAARRSGLAAA